MSEKINNENNSGLLVGTNKGTINNFGLSYSDVKDICTDLIKNELCNYSQISNDIINARLEEFQNELIESIKCNISEQPNILEAFRDPAVQNDTFEAEKSYIKRGNGELKTLLLRVLKQRISNYDSNDDLLNIVLGESVKVASLLTSVQYKILSLGFILKYTKWLNVTNKNSLKDRINNDLIPLFKNLTTKKSDFQHLEFTSCVQVSAFSSNLIDWFKQYEGIFSHGFDDSDRQAIISISPLLTAFIQGCINDYTKFQFKALNEDDVVDFCDKNNISSNDKDTIIKLYKKSMPSDLKIELIAIVPELEDLFKIWDQTNLKNLQLTSVGIVIGAENIDATGKNYNLKIWI